MALTNLINKTMGAIGYTTLVGGALGIAVAVNTGHSFDSLDDCFNGYLNKKIISCEAPKSSKYGFLSSDLFSVSLASMIFGGIVVYQRRKEKKRLVERIRQRNVRTKKYKDFYSGVRSGYNSH